MAIENSNTTLTTFNYQFAKRNGVLVQGIENDHAVIVHNRPITPKILLEIRRYLQSPLKLQLVSVEQFDTLLTETYEAGSKQALAVAQDISEEMDLTHLIEEMPKSADLLESEGDAPIIRFLNALFSQAIRLQASDIHIEPFESKLLIRFRIDGVLHVMFEPPRIIASLITSRVKVMAKLDIAEKRLPQDGRITLHMAGRNIDVRVSTLPSQHGERVVLRLLDKRTALLDLSHLGMADDHLAEMQKLIHITHGIILVTGPTGSGKTTTLYAALTDLNDSSRNILTIEDPIEYDIPGIGQTQVNPKINLTFSAGLRTLLRQDPDVVMIGEIRDLETAEIAVQASLTGHLVFSTLHTNNAVGAMTRLRDMGVESFLLASSVIGILAQRLVRILCKHCKKTITPDEAQRQLLGLKPSDKHKIYEAVGCDECQQMGYRRRTGIYELIVIDERLRQMIHEDANEQLNSAYAFKNTRSMQQDGFRRVLAGETTLEEVLRVTTER